MAPPHETSLVAEIPCFPKDVISSIPDELLAARVIDELVQAGIIGRSDLMEWRHHLLPFAYPVYSVGYGREVTTITDCLATFTNLDTLGRAGSFYYSHLHDQFRLSKNYVEALKSVDAKSVAFVNGNDEINEAYLNAALR